MQPFGTFPAHALQGLTLPLVVLAVLGIGATAGAACALAGARSRCSIVPGTLYRVDELAQRGQRGPPAVLPRRRRARRAALPRRARRSPAACSRPVYTGLLVPAYTGRETWVGAGSWTPDFRAREQAAEQLFSGALDAGARRRRWCAARARASCSRTATAARTSRRLRRARRRAAAALRLRDGVGGARMRRRRRAVVALAGPTALAFFSGGYFDEARLWAALAACVLLVRRGDRLAAAALAVGVGRARRARPAGRLGVAVGGLGAARGRRDRRRAAGARSTRSR